MNIKLLEGCYKNGNFEDHQWILNLGQHNGDGWNCLSCVNVVKLRLGRVDCFECNNKILVEWWMNEFHGPGDRH